MSDSTKETILSNKISLFVIVLTTFFLGMTLLKGEISWTDSFSNSSEV